MLPILHLNTDVLFTFWGVSEYDIVKKTHEEDPHDDIFDRMVMTIKSQSQKEHQQTVYEKTVAPQRKIVLCETILMQNDVPAHGMDRVWMSFVVRHHGQQKRIAS